METKTTEVSVTYFPYTFLEEKDLKRLLLYFSNIRFLEVLPDFASALPDQSLTGSLVHSFCPFSSSLVETIRRAHQTYIQFGNVHQNGGLVELLRTYALQEDLEDTRTGLVAHIRQGLPRLDPEEIELVNDAVFLLLAHELDLEHAELDLQLDRIRRLETKLHQEVGIGTEEEGEALAMSSVSLAESDHPRTLYPMQRLRAWTRLYCIHQDPEPFLPLTTSLEVLGELSELLPSLLSDLTDRPLATSVVQRNLSTLPDPQSLSLEEILEFRETMSREGVLSNWWESVGVAIKRLQQETLTEDQWGDLQERLQRAADEFNQHWPGPEEPAQHLRLDSICYPGVDPKLAFSLATGLQPADSGLPFTKGRNGITLLLSPSALPQDDRR